MGCYGANILRVLAGSGFSLHWYPGGGGGGGASGMHAQATSAQSTVKITGSPANTSARSSPPLPKCGCLYGDAAARQEMVVKMNK